ncbi:MAG TPA: response regulator [Desulfobacterales bacterium]|nr:response regulator [Desulfobacterales bacterium]
MVSETQNETGRLRLLLVDDEVGFATIMAKRLTRRDMVVTTAFSGTQGIQALRAKQFDVAVLDLKMEDMDGIEVLKVFKIMDPNMPVIMLTGHGSEESAKEGIQHGAYDYLTKPYEFTELLEKIREAAIRVTK